MRKLLKARRISLLLLFTAGMALLSPPVRWRILGYAKNESFYQGRPTSYWSGRITTWRQQFRRYAQTGLLPSEEWWGNSLPAALRRVFPGPNDRQALIPPLSLDDEQMPIGGAFISDPAALAVMMELVGDPDYDICLYALQRLIALDAQVGRTAVPLLIEVLRWHAHAGPGRSPHPARNAWAWHPDVDLRRRAAQGLYHFGADQPEAIAALIDALEADDDWTCTYAALALGELGARAKAAVPSMVRLLEKKRSAGPPINRYVPETIKRIDRPE